MNEERKVTEKLSRNLELEKRRSESLEQKAKNAFRKSGLSDIGCEVSSSNFFLCVIAIIQVDLRPVYIGKIVNSLVSIFCISFVWLTSLWEKSQTKLIQNCSLVDHFTVILAFGLRNLNSFGSMSWVVGNSAGSVKVYKDNLRYQIYIEAHFVPKKPSIQYWN